MRRISLAFAQLRRTVAISLAGPCSATSRTSRARSTVSLAASIASAASLGPAVPEARGGRRGGPDERPNPTRSFRAGEHVPSDTLDRSSPLREITSDTSRGWSPRSLRARDALCRCDSRSCLPCGRGALPGRTPAGWTPCHLLPATAITRPALRGGCERDRGRRRRRQNPPRGRRRDPVGASRADHPHLRSSIPTPGVPPARS
jgi:hypothetical protein